MPPPSSPETSPNQTAQFSLDPIRDLGASALDPQGLSNLSKVILRQIEATRETTYHETLTVASDDLLKSSGDSPLGVHSIPSDATLKSAILDFLFTDRDRPHRVLLHPPAGISIEFPGDAARILSWLRASPLRIANAIAASGVALILIIASAISPVLGDGDGDDDDPITDRHSLRA